MTALSDALPDPDTRPDFYTSVTTKRALAWLVDVVILSTLSVIAVVLTAFIGAFFFPLLYLVISFLYRVTTIANGSATWGMRLFSIELLSGEGRKLTGTEALLHTLGYLVSWALAPLQLVSVILMLGSARGQGLSDHLLNTTAVNRPLR
ncbi:RDD family protein [Pseudooceanicola algae]|uniref:RDD domain-containing protein n=1 Tax=Pseudooceanicola algae TaxID=1537215 RepID=A0A418SDI6_9RHOB|nr:RDD family protein [Pseudooceanicola algae]QPM89427.1 hypothetical protein PSAL_006460 [Pseudooceanicola algae]